MNRLSKFCGFGLLGLALVVSVGVSQDTKKTEKKVKTQLPTGFKDLGLTAEQKAKIGTIQQGYRTQIADLSKKIAELKKQESQEVFKILTDEQRDQYLKTKGLDAKDKKKPAEKK